MEKKNQNGFNGLVNPTYTFKYVETTWIDGNEISSTEKTWSAENLNDYDRFRDLWQELEVSDEHYELTDLGTILEDGNVAMVDNFEREKVNSKAVYLERFVSVLTELEKSRGGIAA